jgi:branched-chain amino acid transport system ATP-binding protein
MTEPLLRVRGLTAGYGIVQVLRGLDLEVMPSEAVVILGANGAGKTTTLRALSGMIPTKGVIEFDGLQLKRRRPESLLRLGIAHVPQGRGTITDLTVEENLRVGASNRKERDISSDIDRWYEVFPRLKERREQHAGSMSGGEQQMLAIARAYMSRPPIVTRDLFSTVAQLARDAGTALLIVEQNANLALEFASRGYVLEAGQFVAQGTSAELLADDAIQRAYLGA